MKGVALIDGRSRPYFQGIERVLNSQQREALAQGVWQVLETIPDDFESFEFQFAGTQVYIHKLSQDQILLVLTHDNLIYPDYFDAFSRLREAFNQDSGATMDAFQRLLGARNTKVTPLNLSDVANREDEPASPEVSLGAVGLGANSGDIPSGELDSSDEPPTLEIPTLEIPSGSADYAVAADTEITDISAAAVEPDAPVNAGSNIDDDLPATVLLDADEPLDEAAGLPEFAATEAGLPDLGGAEVGGAEQFPDLGIAAVSAGDSGHFDNGAADGALPADDAAAFAASLADANALVGRRSTAPEATNRPADELSPDLPSTPPESPIDLPVMDGEEDVSASLPEVDSLLAVTQPPPEAAAVSPGSADPQADLAALMDTLSLGEEDFESQSGTTADAGQADAAAGSEAPVTKAPVTKAPVTEAALPEEAALPDMGEVTGDSTNVAETAAALPDVVEAEAAETLNPWDDPEAAAAVLNEALSESKTAQPKREQPLDEPLLAVTQPATEATQGDEATERSLNNRLDAVALDDDIEIDDLFGYEEPVAAPAPPQADHAVLESYVESLNSLGEFSAHYLGRAVIVNYWRTSRPADEWLQGAFAIERSANSIRLGPDYAASRRSPVTDGQQVALQTWAEQFVSRCSKVIRDFPQLAQQSLSEDQSKMLNL